MTSDLPTKYWLKLLDSESNSFQRFVIYKHATRQLPRSYKLWYRYLSERVDYCLTRRSPLPTDRFWLNTRKAFRNCLVHLRRMPLIWLLYADIVANRGAISECRYIFNEALRALPFSQHDIIWNMYVTFIETCGVPSLSSKVYERYVMLNPDAMERWVDFSISTSDFPSAVKCLLSMIDCRSGWPRTRTKHTMWKEVCSLMANNPLAMDGQVEVEAVLRAGIKRYSSEVGQLWCALGEYYTRLGLFERARVLFEEALGTVGTVRDFAIIFDAYTQFEESLITSRMELINEGEEVGYAIDMRLFRLETLMNRRPILLNDVMLRQNPNNVAEWLKKASLYRLRADTVDTDVAWSNLTDVYTEGLRTIVPELASGSKLSKFWIQFAALYEENGEITSARGILQNSTTVPFKSNEELVSIWCAWVEMEIRCKDYSLALDVVRRATTVPKQLNRRHNGENSAVYRSARLWAMYADLEESFGTIETVRAVYEQTLSLKVATPQMILNFAKFLQKHRFFEESFRVYERSLGFFKYPHNYPIWSTYLCQFIERYGGRKMERLRELFEEALRAIPQGTIESKSIFLLFAKTEEEVGLPRRAMGVYDRTCTSVSETDRFEMFQLYIARTTELFGLAKTREIFERAIQTLPVTDTIVIGCQYAQVELRLGEVDRSRSIFLYISQFCDPTKELDFWNSFNEFEVQYGNEYTFREMIRIRRTVEANLQYDHFFEKSEDNITKLQALEAEIGIDQESSTTPNIAEVSSPAEIDLDNGIELTQQTIPVAVFGVLASDSPQYQPMGAMERFKKKRKVESI